MTVGSVTYMSTGGIESFARPRGVWAPPLAQLAPTPSSHPLALRGTRGTHRRAAERAAAKAASGAASKVALRKLAFKLVWKAVKPRPLEIAGELVRPLAWMIYRKYIQPTGFPGWGTFPEGFLPNAQCPYPGIAPGDYTLNGFGALTNWTTVFNNLVDLSDGAPIPGYRYWGHYLTNPLPGGAPGEDWAVEDLTMPMPGTASRPGTAVRYRSLPNLATFASAPPWTPRSGIEFAIGEKFKVRLDPPRVRDRGDKAKPANMFVYRVLKRFANAGGEIKEWTDILAQASGYIKGSMMLPEDLRDTGKETQAKLYWLFVVAGINYIDWDLLAELVIDNEIEDAIYGFAGQLSKSAAQSLGLTVGPQTGLVM